MFLIEISFVDEVNVLNLCRPLPEPSNPLLTVAVGQAKKRVQFNIKKNHFFDISTMVDTLTAAMDRALALIGRAANASAPTRKMRHMKR